MIRRLSHKNSTIREWSSSAIRSSIRGNGRAFMGEDVRPFANGRTHGARAFVNGVRAFANGVRAFANGVRAFANALAQPFIQSSTIPGNARGFYGRASSSIRRKIGKFDHSRMTELEHSRMVELLWESLLFYCGKQRVDIYICLCKNLLLPSNFIICINYFQSRIHYWC